MNFEEMLERYEEAGWKHITGKWVMMDDKVIHMFGAPPDIRHLCSRVGFLHHRHVCGECGEKVPDILKAYKQLNGYYTR